MNRFIATTLFFLLSLFFFSFYSQDNNPLIVIAGSVNDENYIKLNGVKVEVKQDDKIFKSVLTTSKGKYLSMELPFGFIYRVTFSKDKFASKSILLDAKNGFFPDDPQKNFTIPLTILLQTKQPDIDYSLVTDQDVAKFKIINGVFQKDNTYNSQRKNEIDRYFKNIEEQAKLKEANFKKLVSEGDKALNKEEYPLAILKFEEALKIKNDDLVTGKIERAKKNLQLLSDQKDLQKQYDDLITKGDNALSGGDNTSALSNYNSAKNLMPGNQIAYDKIKEIDKLKDLAIQKELDQKFNNKMKEAKAAFESKDFQVAINLYKEASKIDQSKKSPKDKITEINNLLENQKSNDQDYNNLISKADGNLLEKSFEVAISNYTKALKIKPNESYPKEQIIKAEDGIKASLADMKLDKEYEVQIKIADDQLNNSDYELAKESYQNALKIKSSEAYPNEKIKFIDSKLKEILEKNNLKEKVLKQYQSQISIADNLFNEEKLEEAKLNYELAKKIKKDEGYPDQKITEITIKLNHIANQEREKLKKYEDLIKNADINFKSQDWKLAKKLYNDALLVDQNQTYPNDQLLIIEQKIIQQNKLKNESKQKLDNFNSLIAQGDQSIKTENLEVAKAKYSEARDIFPDNPSVIQKIKHLNYLISEKSKLNKLDSSYNLLISKADKLRDTQDWELAKEKYSEAMYIKSLESYPKTQIEFINNKISELSKSATKSEYDDLILQADKLFSELSYGDALIIYNKANKILPEEQYPLSQTREINRLINDKESKDNEYTSLINQADNEYESNNWEKALTHFKLAKAIYDKQYPNKRIEEITSKLNDIRSQDDQMVGLKNQFDELIKNADQLFQESKYSESETKFKEALNIFPDEYYPKKKLAEIKIKLDEIQNNKDKQEKYNNLIVKADAFRDENNFNQSIISYQQAKLIFPENSYPDEQLLLIDQALNQQKEKDIKFKYDQIIKNADDNFSNNKYQISRNLYFKALEIGFSNSYPNQKITEIDQLISEQKELENDKKRDLANKSNFDALVKSAEDAKSNNQLVKSKEIFIQASKIIPVDTYVNEQITELDKMILEQIENKSKDKYNNLISRADKFFEEKNYDKSILIYRKAVSLSPSEIYPAKQIKIASEAKMIAFNNLEKQKEYNKFITQGNRYFSSENYLLAIESFKNATKIDPESQLPKDKLVELNKILDDQPTNGSSNNQTVLNNYSSLYGKEVSGKYSEYEIDKMFSSEKFNDAESLVLEAELKMVNEEQFHLKKTEQQELTTNFQREDINIFYRNIQKSFENSNDSRWANIPKVIDYKELNFSKLNELSLITIDNLSRNYDNIDLQFQVSSDKINLRSDVINQNYLSFVDFFDNKFVSDLDFTNQGMSVTYYNSLKNESFYNELELENISRLSNRDFMIDNFENYNQDLSILNVFNKDHSTNISYKTHVFTENISEFFNENFYNLDIPRQSIIIPSFGYYENDYFAKLSAESNKGINSNYKQLEISQNLISNLNDFMISADEPRKINSINADHYLDKELSRISIWSELNNDKLYNLYFINQMYKDELEIKSENQESNRTSNMSILQLYNDNYLASNQQENTSDINTDYVNYQNLNRLKEVTGKFSSSNNISKLAQQFPEGITEKIYERKDLNGDVLELTIVRIVVAGNNASEYKKIKSKTAVNYFKNGGIISHNIWDTETN